MNAWEFFQTIYGDNVKEVFYRVTESYPYKAMPIQEAVDKINIDIEEMREVLSEYFSGSELDEKAHKAAFGIWKKHLYVIK